MLGLDLIGAGESLAAHTIMLRIRSIDTAKFRKAVTEKAWGGAIPGAIAMVDAAPQFALEVALPVAKTQLAAMGITADLSTTQSPPTRTPPHEMAFVLGLGTAVGIVLAIIGRTIYSLIKAR
jgi:hypothetical protein